MDIGNKRFLGDIEALKMAESELEFLCDTDFGRNLREANCVYNAM